MSSDAFMLPALPQIPASGLNETRTRGHAAFKSTPLGDASDLSMSFSATLNRITDRRCGNNPKATAAEKAGVKSQVSNTDPPSLQKMSKINDFHLDYGEEAKASASKETTPSICLLPGFGLMPFPLLDLSIAEVGSLAAEPPSDSTAEPGLRMLTDLIGHLRPQGKVFEGEQLGIDPFAQLQANISPEAINWAFFEQLGLSDVQQGESENIIGKTARFFEFWQWMFPSASTAQDGELNGQLESFGAKGNAPFYPLLQMLGMTGAARDINTDTSSSNGPKMAVGQEGAHLIDALLDRLTRPSQSAHTGIAENDKKAVAGHDGRLSFWGPGDSNSKTPLEAQARQMIEKSQLLKIQETLKAAAEQPANPNSVTSGITAKSPEEVFGFKSAVQKSELLAVYALGNKISQINGDSKDSGALFSQDQMPQHWVRLENAAQSSEATPRSLMSQTLNQIVQKAALSLHNGQNEVQLHLKPDFLGHIRMQIVSEGQQVAIKIVADLPFVRDMLENHLHQLKADLQAQGLNIDELEVSVAHDSHAEGNTHQNAEAAKLQAFKNGTDSDGGFSEKPGQTESRESGSLAETAIDYFA